MAFEVDVAPMDTQPFGSVLTPAQIETFERGQEEAQLLLDYPRDLAAFGAALTGLLMEPEEAERMGARGRANASASNSPARAACSTTSA